MFSHHNVSAPGNTSTSHSVCLRRAPQIMHPLLAFCDSMIT